MRVFLVLVLPTALVGKEYGMENNSISAREKAVVFGKATEAPYSGEYNEFFKDGIYLCKVCRAPLYRSSDKFRAGCGWPAFDDAFPNAVKEIPDADGVRTEIVCARCGAHLGHIFKGERFTPKDVRHCVNSISMVFVPAECIGRAIVAGGCFWGVEELMRKQKGVFSCVSGYIGGTVRNPSYNIVCTGKSGHVEAVEILFDTSAVSYADIIKRFFEIHDFTQTDGQGPDIGEQYKSAIFYLDESQRKEASDVIKSLEAKGFSVATRLDKAGEFYPAETYHQRYYETKKQKPYCHIYRKIFD